MNFEQGRPSLENRFHETVEQVFSSFCYRCKDRLAQYGILMLLDISSAKIEFVDLRIFQKKGQKILTPINFVYDDVFASQKAEKCDTIFLRANIFSQLKGEVAYDRQTFFMTPKAFDTVVIDKISNENESPLDFEPVQTRVTYAKNPNPKPRKTPLRLHQLKISEKEIQKIMALDNVWPHGKKIALTMKMMLLEQVNQGWFPNKKEALFDALLELELFPYQTSYYETKITETTRTPILPSFSLTHLKDTIAFLLNEHFSDIEFSVTYPKISFSDFRRVYGLMLAIAHQVSEYDDDDDFEEDNFEASKRTSPLAQRGIQYHILDALFDALDQNYVNKREVFPNNLLLQQLFQEMTNGLYLPLFPSQQEVEDIYEQLILRYAMYATQQAEDQLVEDSVWLLQKDDMIRGAKLLSDVWVTSVLSGDRFGDYAYREIPTLTLIKGDPIGMMIYARKDAIYKNIRRVKNSDEQKKISIHHDLKVRRNLYTDPLGSKMKQEIDRAEKLLITYLDSVFLKSRYFKNGILTPQRDPYIVSAKSEPRIYQEDLDTILRLFNPENGIQIMDPLISSLNEMEEFITFLHVAFIPMVHILHKFQFKEEDFWEALT